jgi:predicted nucleic acid-binding protein
VISALFDGRNPERQSLTKEFFGRIESFDVFVSELTLAEISATPDHSLRETMLSCVSPFAVIEKTSDVETVAETLVAHEAVPVAFSEDALHIAFAITHDIDFLLSWNFKHIVRRKTKDVVRMVAGISGYRNLEIFTPPELL